MVEPSGTVTTNVSVAVPPAASVTSNVIVDVPNLPVAVVTAMLRFEPLPPSVSVGVSVGFEDVAVTTMLAAAVSVSSTRNGIAEVDWPAWIVRLFTSEILGGMFVPGGGGGGGGGGGTGFTVTSNVSIAVNVPSLTTTVIVAVPTSPAAVFTVTVRFEPEPPNEITGVSAVFDEVAVTVSELEPVSKSVMKNGSADVGEPLIAVVSSTSEICGAVFGAGGGGGAGGMATFVRLKIPGVPLRSDALIATLPPRLFAVGMTVFAVPSASV